MKHLRSHGLTAVILILLLPVLVLSCHAQDKKRSQAAQNLQSVADPADSARQPVDPLFFIEGQLCAWVRNMHQDRRGDLWFGTNHVGGMRYNGDTLEYFSKEAGLGGGRINTIVEDDDGNVWFATWGGLTRYDGTSFTNFTIGDDPMDNEISGLTIDSKGNFWVGTMQGVYRFDGEKFTPFPIPKIAVRDTSSILSYDGIGSILEDSRGNLWFGTDGFGLCKYDGESFTHFTKDNGFCDNNIADLMEDSRGNVWIGTMFGGISRWDGETFTHLTQDGIVQGDEAYGLYEDTDGNVWFAAEHQGVYRYDGETFTLFNKDDGLETLGILSMLEDREGRFWMGGWGGLFRYRPGLHDEEGKLFVSVTREGPWH